MIQNPLLEELCAFSDVIHLFQEVGCVRNKLQFHTVQQNPKSSLGRWIEIRRLLALELWDLIVSVLGNMTQTTERTERLVVIDRGQRSQGKINALNNIDCVPANVQSSHQEALLYVFNDNEAVIKMIIKGRSPTMRHVSRTNRVALDWLFDQINLDPKIQLKYIDTKNQLADILTKEISHVMSGIIFCACSIPAISVLQCALIQWRNDLNTIQEKNESQQNRDQ